MSTISLLQLGPSINDGYEMFTMSLKDRVELKQPPQSILLNNPI